MTRDRPIIKGCAALLIIDVQNGTCGPKEAETRPEFYKATALRVIPNIAALLAAFRTAGLEVIYTVIENLTKDGRDRSLDYKISGISVAKGSWDAQVCDAITPGEDEIVLRKNSSNAFISTNIDYLLRSMGKRQVILCGVITDQCVESAVRDACDLGYLVTLVPDACATYTVERQEASVRAIKGYCRQLTTDALEAELSETS